MADIIVPTTKVTAEHDLFQAAARRSTGSDVLAKVVWSNTAAKRFYSDLTVHGNMMDRSGIDARPSLPIYYMRLSSPPPPVALNSIDSPINKLAESYYNAVNAQLGELRELSGTEDEVIEKGAIDTALTVLDSLHQHHLAPPEIAYHGGDAVVMLWGLGSSTYAITITDGEVGWVLRRDQRQISSRDSVRVTDFKLVDMR